MRRDVTAAGGVEVARKASRLAIGANIDLITDRTVEAGTNNIKHTAE